jgi:hypothetical protein
MASNSERTNVTSLPDVNFKLNGISNCVSMP